MQYDFDTPIDRTHTWSIKHDFKKENGKADDILPLWVADMDFRSPDSVVEALKKAVDHGISVTAGQMSRTLMQWQRGIRNAIT